METPLARWTGLTVAGVSLAVSGAMALLALSDGLARYTLSGEPAQQHAEQVCVRIPGCQSLTLDAGYDWRNAGRRVIYHLQLNGAEVGSGMGVGMAERNQLATTFPQLVREETSGLLHWTLGAPAVLDIQVRPSSPALPHPSFKPTTHGGHTWN